MALRALLYKNWCIRKRYYFRSLFELLFPISLLCLLLYFKKEVPVHDANPSGESYQHNQVIYPSYSKENIFEKLLISKFDILYTPDNTLTQSIMRIVKETLPLNSLQGFKNEEELEKWLFDHKNDSEVAFIQNTVCYGVIFNNLPGNSLEISYTLRSTDPSVFDTGNLFPKFQVPGPMEAGEVYLREGFLQLKIAIDDAFISTMKFEIPKNFSIQEFPYPEYKIPTDNIQNIFVVLLPLVLVFGFYKLFVTTVSVAISEKVTGLTERMKMCGANPFSLVLNWIIYSSMLYLISTFLMSVLLKIPVNGSSLLNESNLIIIWIILILYCNSSVFFMLALSSFFNNVSLATTVSLIVHLVMFFAANQLTHFGNVVVISKFIISLFPSCSLGWIFEVIANLEASGEGATFTTLFTRVNNNDLPLFFILLSNILGSISFIFIYWYVSNIRPGPYGIPKPWYFIIPTFVLSKCRVQPKSGLLDDEESYSDSIYDSKPLYEKVPSDLEIGLKIINLKKKYGNVTAVRKVTLDIYRSQITVLLGHNGAGKTTTMSMLTGLIPPTNGNVYYKGKSIYRNIEEYQKRIGLCTQHDLFHDVLSVEEHLVFFGLIKGLSRNDAKTEALNIINKLNLHEKKNSDVKELSGGMKRKLCLGIALLCNPDILILDEPSSGLDPESRREIWNILLRLRENRTFLLTTHFMEEADVLGDRIAIMDHGEITCYGTSMFLKKHYGTGYQLTVVLKNGDYNRIENIIKERIPEMTMSNKTGDQVIFTLPSSMVTQFPALFKELENEEKIIEMGISCTTMEDVFLKVGELNVSRKCDKNGEKNMGTSLGKMKMKKRQLNLLQLFWQRFIALFIKNIVCTYRDWINYVFNVVSIILLAFLTMYTTNLTLEQDLYNKPPLSLNLEVYGVSEVVATGSHLEGKLYDAFNKIVTMQGSYITSYNDSRYIIDHLLDLAEQNEAKFRSSMVIAAEFNESSNKILYSSIASHAPAIAINTYYNSFLNSLTNSSVRHIETINHPYTLGTSVCSGRSVDLVGITSVWITLLPFVVIYAMGTFIQKSHKENSRHLKHLMLMTGVSPFTYWFATFFWDLIICSSYIIFSCIVLHFSDRLYFIDNSFLFIVFFIYFMLFISQLWFGYLFSFLFKTQSSASLLCTFLSTSLGFVGFSAVNFVQGYKILKFILKLNPLCPFLLAFSKICTFLFYNFTCSACSSSNYPYCSEDHKFKGNIFSWNNDGINEELIFLACDWMIYAALIFLVDFGYFPFLWNCIKIKYYNIGMKNEQSESTENDVAKEKDAVDAVLQENISSVSAIAVVVDSLVKKFSRSFTAVNSVSFRVRRGEVFGLLGVNGAGKSTTFNMLTGLLLPSSGNAYINEKSLKKNRSQYLSLIGYCPQFDGLMEEMTSEEQLKVFALLRGVPSSEVNEVVAEWIQLLDLEEYTNIISKNYSGGTKRKLNTALSLIGDSQVVLLDEPTTGVDPVTRRNLWNVLKETHDRKQSIVLSSHSMEECEAVCHRLTIMAKGRMQCIGNVQHLKALYGCGFSVFVKLKSEHTDEELIALKNSIEISFGVRCVLKDEHKSLLQYHVDESNYTISFMFEKMENLKMSNAIIEDYVINDTNLEQIFLSFAKNEMSG